jgi:hypothetical protein
MCRLALLLLLGSIAFGPLASTGCSASKPNDRADPLVGTWFAQITPVSSDDQTETLTLTANKTFTSVHSQVNSPKAATQSGCTETVTDTGTFSDDGSIITMETNAGASGRVIETLCPIASDDGTFIAAPLFPSLSLPYTVTDTTLTLESVDGSGATTFTRH